MKKILLLHFIIISFFYGNSQQLTTFPINGVDEPKSGLYAFTNATIYLDYKTKLDHATLIIKDGKVWHCGNAIEIPADAIVVDMMGKFIYPSFIDLYSNYGEQPISKKPSSNDEYISNKKGAYGWNEAIKPEVQGVENFVVDNKKADDYLKSGFGVVLTHVQDGIARGTGTLVNLNTKRENEVVLRDKVSNQFSFSKGSSEMGYPSSEMGAIALIRQTYYDAIWYKNENEKKEYNLSLEAWNQNQNLVQIFETNDKLDILRADKIGDEFGIQYIFKSVGNEYQRAAEIKATNGKLIVPLNFPKPYDVEDPFDALMVSLDDMKSWEMAPANAYFINKAAIDFCFTSSDLEKREDFLTNLRKAVQYGLSEEAALKALTFNPAMFVKALDIIGSLEKGKEANFIITSKNIFDKDCIIYQNWVMGEKHTINNYDFKDVRGTYKLTMNGNDYSLLINGTAELPIAELMKSDSSKIKASFSRTGNLISLNFNLPKDKDTISNFYLLSASLTADAKNWIGTAENNEGKWFGWSATKTAEFVEPLDKKDTLPKPFLGNILYPFVAYGNETIPQPENVLFKNATVWTNEAEGILKNADVLVLNGKIIKVGTGLNPMGAQIIDATGKYITCGIIDEHSHICISNGVNEGTQASSAEVRIGDVVNSEDINMYRQLSGGVVAAQLLHGSANPIGGQSALIKLRWGQTPEQMKIAGADGFIKFALGENVKQSNWGDRSVTRYPQTRMGVEQVYINYFSKAQQYDLLVKKKALNTTMNFRRDLELEALSEIINKKRFITCHSYVQSEINMLMHVADTFGFRVNTFTHILEGYKVADKMKAHGVNASTFADWWAYKYEVIDAIPYNAYILNKVGVNTCINSDDAEMGRRLNQEAAKTIKYGGLTEEEAWKTITLNPAIALHLDNKMGSIKAGKDADIVMWSENPLSVYAQVEKTMIDGIIYYDKAADAKKRELINAERTRLIQKMLEAKKGGIPTQKPTKKIPELNGCMGFESE